MVVEEVQDLDRRSVGELPGGGVALPGLVGQLSLEADEGAARSFVGLRRDQAVALEDAPDGGRRGQLLDLTLEVVEDGPRSAIEAGLSEFPAQL